MIIIMKNNSEEKDVEKVVSRVKELGYETHLSQGKNKTIIGIIGDFDREELIESLAAYPEIDRMVPIQEPYKLAGKSFKQDKTVIQIDDIEIGGKEITLMAGPCAVESEQQIIDTAVAVKEAGAQIL